MTLRTSLSLDGEKMNCAIEIDKTYLLLGCTGNIIFEFILSSFKKVKQVNTVSWV
jgi:hypothetical protein